TEPPSRARTSLGRHGKLLRDVRSVGPPIPAGWHLSCNIRGKDVPAGGEFQMKQDVHQLTRRVQQLEQEAARLRAALASSAKTPQRRGPKVPIPKNPAKPIRKRSRTQFWGLPLWEIASGPDQRRGETRGHARAVFAVGDIADGLVAIGGIARGV